MIAYASRTLNKAERNYSTIEKEVLAIVFAVKHFRHYLWARKVLLLTDHKPIQWLGNHADTSTRLLGWMLKLQEYDIEFKYREGRANANADTLSRMPNLAVITSPVNKHTMSSFQKLPDISDVLNL